MERGGDLLVVKLAFEGNDTRPVVAKGTFRPGGREHESKS